jgi:hypothetical protein
LDDEVGGAEVDESFHGVLVGEIQVAHHVLQPLLTVGLVRHVPIAIYDLEPLRELLFTKHFAHVVLELFEFTARDVNHLLLLLVIFASSCFVVSGVIVSVIVGRVG